MARLLTVEVRIAGEYREIWLYKKRLYAWDRTGRLTFCELDSAFRHIAHHKGVAAANLAQTLIFRNDWKVGEQFRSMMSVPEVQSAFLMPFYGADTLVIDLPAQLFSSSESEPYDGTVLDTSIYADRVYLATTEGLLESYINSRAPNIGYPLSQQIDVRASRVTVRYAAINVSAEEKGLHFAKVLFAGDEPGFRQYAWNQVAETSYAASYASHNLLNYADESVPRLLTARTEEAKSHPLARYDETQVVGYEGEMPLSALVGSAFSGARMVSTRDSSHSHDVEDLEVIGNSNYHLLAVSNDKVRVIDIRAKRTREVEAKPSTYYQALTPEVLNVEEVLQTYPLSNGFIVELHDSLRLMTREGSFTLASGAAARVRTFASSVRHKEAIAVVFEQHASLFGFFITSESLF